MYNFQRRLSLAKRSLDDFENAQNTNRDLVMDELEVYIMLARTVTFVMQKELSRSSGFEKWYATKQIEMREKYQYLIDIRNIIEKEGSSPVKSSTVIIDFAPYSEAKQKVGVRKYPDGKVEDVMCEINHIRYFDKEQKKEILSSSKEYFNYLDALVSEAVTKFPQK